MSAVATSLGLMRRLPPAKVEQNLSGLLNLLPDDQEELLQRIDQPLEVATDADVSSIGMSKALGLAISVTVSYAGYGRKWMNADLASDSFFVFILNFSPGTGKEVLAE
mgnify:CR=1 FL=1|jgi:hypothetical protein